MIKDRPVPNFIAKKMYKRHSGSRIEKEKKLVNSGIITLGQKIIDIGCGPGHISVEMAQATGESGEVYALDIHPLAIKSVENLIEEKGITNMKTILTGEFKTGLPNNSIDIIFIINTYDMIRNKKKLHAEVKRVLKLDGKLIICNKRTLLTSVNKFRKLFNKGDNIELYYQEKNVYYYKKV